MSHLFTGSDHAKSYKQFRPQCPTQILDIIIKYCEAHGNEFKTAIDLGCGSGQNTVSLAPNFSSVIGIDVSEAQIREAQNDNSKPDNVQYKVNSAEDLTFLNDRSVDLITVATAFHWMDAEQVYKEAQRVLKPGGVMAMFALEIITMDHKPSNDCILNFYQTLDDNDCWHKKNKDVMNQYADLPPMPFEDICRYDSLFISQNLKLKEVMGYLMSWSSYQTYMTKYPGATLASDTTNKLCSMHGNDDSEVPVKWKFFLRIGYCSS